MSSNAALSHDDPLRIHKAQIKSSNDFALAQRITLLAQRFHNINYAYQ